MQIKPDDKSSSHGDADKVQRGAMSNESSRHVEPTQKVRPSEITIKTGFQSHHGAQSLGSGHLKMNALLHRYPSIRTVDPVRPSLAETPFAQRFGLFSYRPDFLQMFNRPAWFVVFIFCSSSLAGFINNGLFALVITSIEKRFKLTSVKMSFAAVSFSLSSTALTIYLGWVGSRLNRPLSIARGLVVVAIGGLIFTLPHFLTDIYNPTNGGEISVDICMPKIQNITKCDSTDAGNHLSKYLPVFIIARAFMGAGVQGLNILTMFYLDDSVNRDTYSFYITIVTMAHIVGPALAFTVGGYALNLHTDFYKLDVSDHNMDPSDPRWVGAWWLGFLLASMLLVIMSIPLAGFPRELPGSEHLIATKITEAHNTLQCNVSKEAGVQWNTLLGFLSDLFRNPAFLGITVCTALDNVCVAAIGVFGPKVFENQYGLDKKKAGTIFGMILVPATTTGLLSGGYIIKKLHLHCGDILKLISLFKILAAPLMLSFLMYCDRGTFAGISSNSTSMDKGVPLIYDCIKHCHCEEASFFPVCGTDAVQYFSPCHAGCSGQETKKSVEEQTSNGQTFVNCSCVESEDKDSSARGGFCDYGSCWKFPLSLVLLFLACSLTSGSQGMSLSAVIRVVPGSHRSLAISLAGVLYRILGAFGPVYLGKLLDNACSLWEDDCDRKGSCIRYHQGNIALYLSTSLALLNFLGFLAIFLGAFLYNAPLPTEELSLEKVSQQVISVKSPAQETTAQEFSED